MNATMQATSRLFQAFGAVVAAIQVSRQIQEVVQLAARYETLGVVLNKVGVQAGYTAKYLEQTERALEKTGISFQASRQTAIQFIQSQIGLADATKLARVAQDAAVVANLNSSETLLRLLHGVQSGNAMILRTVGINVMWEESYSKLAESMHKTVGQLTEHEKTQARMNAVIESGKTLVGAYESAMGTAGKQVLSMERYLEDLKGALGEVFLPMYTKGVFAFVEAIKLAHEHVGTLAGIMAALAAGTLFTALATAIAAVGAAATALGVSLVTIGLPIAGLAVTIGIVVKLWADWHLVMKNVTGSTGKFVELLERMVFAVASLATEGPIGLAKLVMAYREYRKEIQAEQERQGVAATIERFTPETGMPTNPFTTSFMKPGPGTSMLDRSAQERATGIGYKTSLTQEEEQKVQEFLQKTRQAQAELAADRLKQTSAWTGSLEDARKAIVIEHAAFVDAKNVELKYMKGIEEKDKAAYLAAVSRLDLWQREKELVEQVHKEMERLRKLQVEMERTGGMGGVPYTRATGQGLVWKAKRGKKPAGYYDQYDNLASVTGEGAAGQTYQIDAQTGRRVGMAPVYSGGPAPEYAGQDVTPVQYRGAWGATPQEQQGMGNAAWGSVYGINPAIPAIQQGNQAQRGSGAFAEQQRRAQEKALAMARLWETVWTQAIRNTQDEFANFFANLNENLSSFGSFLKSLVRMWLNAMSQIAAANLMRAIFGNMSSTSGIGGWIGKILGMGAPVIGQLAGGGGSGDPSMGYSGAEAQGYAYNQFAMGGGSAAYASPQHEGGTAGTGSVGLYAAAMFAGAPRLHRGLRLRPNEVPVILKRGEQVIPEGQSPGGAPTVVIQQAHHYHFTALDTQGLHEMLMTAKHSVAAAAAEGVRGSTALRRAFQYA